MSNVGSTRRTVHGIAEHILAAHGRRNGGSIKLVVSAAGLESQPPGADRLALVDGVLRRLPDGPEVALRGTFGDLARELGVPFGMPDPPYSPASGVAADDPVEIDAGALMSLVGSLSRGAEALAVLARHHDLDDAPPPLWPEHLDVAIVVGEVNVGVSPGDDYFAEPYAYVGPWSLPEGPFWNAPFGAAKPMADLPDIDDVVMWFEVGLREVARSRTP
jgi:hypothetical protein